MRSSSAMWASSSTISTRLEVSIGRHCPAIRLAELSRLIELLRDESAMGCAQQSAPCTAKPSPHSPSRPPRSIAAPSIRCGCASRTGSTRWPWWCMVTSGWRIYNAAPFFRPSRSLTAITLGGWLGGALQWHFAAMWLLAVNGLVYLALNMASGRLCRKFFPLSPSRRLARRARRAARPAVARRPAPLQQRAELGLPVRDARHRAAGAVGPGAVEVGAVRRCCATCWAATSSRAASTSSRWRPLVAFVAVHLVMVALVPRTLLTMIRGRARERAS